MRMSVRRTVSEAGASIPWLTDEKSQHTEKDPAAGKGWRQMEKGVAEKEMVRSQWIWISKLWEMRTEEAVLLQSMGLQWVGHHLATEQQQLIYGKINLNLTSYTEINSILITGLSVTCNMYAQSHHSCLTICYSMDCSPPGSSVHGILQAMIPEWVAMPSSRGSSLPRDWTPVSCISPELAGGIFTTNAIPGKSDM